VRYKLKQASEGAIPRAVERILETAGGTKLETLLDDVQTLVPVPGSAPLYKGGLWVPDLICTELSKRGVGKSVHAVLSRRERVPKSSSSSSASDRPDPERHRRSMDCEQGLLVGSGGPVLLVDDVVTRGSTMMGCILKLRELHPELEINGFALARVESKALESTSDMLSLLVQTVTYDPQGSPPLIRS
jgi:predicted amidophosphoribosyltransferase